jgi:hypothetical protein
MLGRVINHRTISHIHVIVIQAWPADVVYRALSDQFPFQHILGICQACQACQTRQRIKKRPIRHENISIKTNGPKDHTLLEELHLAVRHRIYREKANLLVLLRAHTSGRTL